jgi:hypothetical protein
VTRITVNKIDPGTAILVKKDCALIPYQGTLKNGQLYISKDVWTTVLGWIEVKAGTVLTVIAVLDSLELGACPIVMAPTGRFLVISDSYLHDDFLEVIGV